MYCAIPLDKWLQNELNYLIDKFLNKSTVERYMIADYNAIERLINRYRKGESYLYNRIWALIILFKFLSKTN